MSNAALVTTTPARDYEGLALVVSPREALARYTELQAIVREVMVVDVHYGTIPGTKKPTLYQSGAQLLTEVYALSTTYEDVETIQDWEHGFFHYRKRCVLRSRNDDRFICDGLGSCNSRESKYAGRWAFESEVPGHLDRDRLKKREGVSRKNGQRYVQYLLDNEEIYSLVNTIEKMACKRALIMGVIGATRSAGIFSQDLENIPESAFGAVEEHGSWERETREQRQDRIDASADVAPALKNQPPPANTTQASAANTTQASAPKRQRAAQAPATAPPAETPPPAERRTQEQIDHARPGPFDEQIRAEGERIDAERAAKATPSTPSTPGNPAPPAAPPVTSAAPPAAKPANPSGNPSARSGAPSSAPGTVSVDEADRLIASATAESARAVHAKILVFLADTSVSLAIRTNVQTAWKARRTELGL